MNVYSVLIKSLILGFLISIGPVEMTAQSDISQTVFLVRHAEKADDGTRDPDLTLAGQRRANKLAVMLKSFDIEHIYSTDYKRTRQTAEPLAQSLGLAIKLYDPREKNTPEEIMKHTGNILIVGHSNSTPTMTNAITKDDKYTQLDEKEYTTLFVVVKVGEQFGSATSKF